MILAIFLDVFLHKVDTLSDCTFCVRNEIEGNLGGGASRLPRIGTPARLLLGTFDTHRTVSV